MSPQNQEQADALFAKGTALLDQAQFANALEQYRTALALWDHPGIRYNMAVTLIHLERPLDALEHLEAALRFGQEALEPAEYKQAIRYQRLLAAQVAKLVVRCDEPGASVSLDGRDFVRCPGEASTRVLAGPHRILGEKPGYLTRTIDLALAGGTEPRIVVDLISLEEATVERRRWTWWKPWGVVAGGALVGGVGLAVELQAHATMRGYDNAVAVLCAKKPCVALPDNVTALYNRAHTEHAVGTTMLVVGGLGLAAGAVLVVMNRARVERIGYPTVTPMFGAKGAGISVALPF